MAGSPFPLEPCLYLPRLVASLKDALRGGANVSLGVIEAKLHVGHIGTAVDNLGQREGRGFRDPEGIESDRGAPLVPG